MEALLKTVQMFVEIPDFVMTALDVLVRASAVLFVYFSTKYRNGEHKPLYYILCLVFPIVGVIVFAVKRKEMNGAGMNKCPSCASLYPPEFAYCHKCNIELPPYDKRKNNLQKTIAKVMVVLFAVFEIATAVPSVVLMVESFGIMTETIKNLQTYGRMSFVDEDGIEVYYDKNGDAHEDPMEVALFTKDGKKYVYSEAIDRYSCAEDGSTIAEENAYVDMDGFLVENKNNSIYFNPKYGTDYSEEEDLKTGFDKFLDTFAENEEVSEALTDNPDVESFKGELSEINIYSHPYYENPFSDDDGNLYFEAVAASWTKDGKLIKSAEDITK